MTAASSCAPIGPSILVQPSPSTKRRRSMMRPRNQRDVVAKGAGAPRAADPFPSRPGACGGRSWLLGDDQASVILSLAYRHQPAPDRLAQFGRRGRHTAAPMSIRACVHVAGPVGGTAASAICLECGRPERSPRHRPATIRPSTRRTLVSTAPTGSPNASAATARPCTARRPAAPAEPARSAGT